MPKSTDNKKKILIVLYGHPEAYPPTLNAIHCLAEVYDIHVFYRAHQESDWIYPPNVTLCPDGEILSAREQEQSSIWKKIWLFLCFIYRLKNQIRRHKNQIILVYDGLGLLAYWLASSLLSSKPKLAWYHNHDVIDLSLIRRYSLSWWAILIEKKIFPELAIFSLPALDRLQYFPMDKFKGQFFYLPNYPSQKIYQPYYIADKPIEEICILFQGQLGPGHGIEEIISMLPFSIQGKPVKLILRGHARNGYDDWLRETIAKKRLAETVSFQGFVPYKNIPVMGAKCHIGLAIFTKQDVMNKTIGTASNKIYEYAALGLPILFFDSPNLRKHLGQFVWAKATDLSPVSILKQLTEIVNFYPELTAAAHQDFNANLNFEHNFTHIMDYLQQKNM